MSKKQQTETTHMKPTTKKQKFVGVKTLVDEETGEEFPMQMNVVEDRDFNFTKVWLQNLVSSLDAITNQKLKLAFWIVEHLDKENQIIMSQREMATATGLSVQTVNRTLRALCEAPEGGIAFLQKIGGGGAYRVNPNVLYKGSYSNRMGICFTFNETAKANDDKDKAKFKENNDLSDLPSANRLPEDVLPLEEEEAAEASM